MENLSSSSLYKDEDQYPEEEYDFIDEPQYAGITATWLRKAIAILSQVAESSCHKKFKSAVKIQSLFRGWHMRKKIALWNEAAIKIQKIWRGFHGRSLFFQILESTTQRRINEYHNKSAIIIQSTFRGYFSRKYIHDHLKLKQLQLEVTTELLKCVALQTRKLFKQQHLPGVYSLRNSKCEKNVNKMLTLLQVKTYNEKVRKSLEKEKLLKEAFKKSIQSNDMTPIPFGICENFADAEDQEDNLTTSAKKEIEP
ncbi:spermatogenesis-associated protein 17-like isoform X2 [Eupeodes corollae]|uniref:spermatogenesis-associated protein 17-like isoform X2 n=1 Tax=Eupeodes corollae TaxID=290404 RepID=UPI00248F6D01|nr:spermatogenesis-associated protein 17-like isoform X2 [Eupeodes corollae]